MSVPSGELRLSQDATRIKHMFEMYWTCRILSDINRTSVRISERLPHECSSSCIGIDRPYNQRTGGPWNCYDVRGPVYVGPFR